MFTRFRCWRRHKQLMRVASSLVHHATVDVTTSPTQVSVAQVVALAFGRYRLYVLLDEATDYLGAALAERGYDIDHLRFGAPPPHHQGGLQLDRDHPEFNAL